MKSLFALMAAVAVIASAQVSQAASCTAGHKGGRTKLIEPTGEAVKTVKSIKAVK